MPDNSYNQNNSASSFLKRQNTIELDLDFLFIWNALKSRYRIIVGCAALALILGAAYLHFQTPLYTATAKLQLNTQDHMLTDLNSLVLSRSNDSASLNTEIDIIRSSTLIRRVIDQLGLRNNEEFKTDVQDPEIAMIQIARAFEERLSVRKDPQSYTVYMSFTSENPRDAKDIVNTLADEYLKFQIEARYEKSRRAYEWLNARVEELRQQVIAAENAVQDFSEQHNLFEVEGSALEDSQIKDLNMQLSLARQDLATARAKSQQARSLKASGGSLSSLPEVLGSPLISSLREQEAELLRQRTELSNQFGPKHPRTADINGQLGNLRGKISAEISRIADGVIKDVEIARQREQDIREQLKALQATSGGAKGFKAELDNLKQEAEATRELYEAFLTRMKETGETEDLEQVNAKIINEASLPLKPSYPKKSLIMLLSLFAGTSGGLAIAFLMSHIYRGFLNPAQVEDYLGLTCLGMVPEVSKKQIMVDMAMAYPSSAHAESLRTMMAGLQFAKEGEAPRSILIISSIPEEGKGWLSTSLARIVAKSGKRVLLLDCDMHRKMSLEVPANDPVKTLNEYLSGHAEIQDIIKVETGTKTHYIGSSPETRNLQELMESDRMKQLMDYAHNEYDMVIVDSPPVIGLSDVLFLSQLVDTAILAIRWMDTPRYVVENALRTLSRARIPLFGAVMTRVNFNQFKRYEYGAAKHYEQYGHYYRSGVDESEEKVLQLSDKS